MDITTVVLKGVLLPAVVSGVLFLVLRPFFNSLAAAIALAAGFIAGFLGVQSYTYPPVSFTQWLPHLATGALLLALLELLWANRVNLSPLKWIVRLGLFCLFLWRLFLNRLTHPSERVRWATDEAFINFLVPILVIFAFWFILDLILKREEGLALENNISRKHAIIPTTLVLITTFSAISIVLSASGIVAQLLGVFTAALGAVMVLAWFNPVYRLTTASSPVIAIVVGSMVWLGGYFFASLPWYSGVLLLVVAPATLLIPLAKDMKLVPQAITRLVIALVPLGAATALAYFASLSRYS